MAIIERSHLVKTLAVLLCLIITAACLSMFVQHRDVTKSVTRLKKMKMAPSVDKQNKGQISRVQLSEQIEQRQRERQQLRKKRCERYYKRKLRRGDYSKLIVNDKYKVIYCYIPKVACTQWHRIFLALDNRNDVTEHEEIHNQELYKHLSQYSNEDIKLRLKTYFKFFFVREPFERLLSAYNDKFVKNRHLWKVGYSFEPFEKQMVKNFKRVDPSCDEKGSFTKFIYYVSGVGFNREPHWTSYDSLCHPCEIDYDFIGHFEHMPDEGPYILRQTGMDRVATFPDFDTNNTTAKLLHEYAQIPKQKIVELAKAFGKDFETLGYKFPGPLTDLLRTSVENP